METFEDRIFKQGWFDIDIQHPVPSIIRASFLCT
jgi:hypothetical protein